MIYVIIANFNVQLIVKHVIKQLLCLVQIFVEMELLLELKNVKMQIQFNMMAAIIVNINANLNVQNV